MILSHTYFPRDKIVSNRIRMDTIIGEVNIKVVNIYRGTGLEIRFQKLKRKRIDIITKISYVISYLLNYRLRIFK